MPRWWRPWADPPVSARERAFAVALGFSVFVHLIVLAGMGTPIGPATPLPQPDHPIEARLVQARQPQPAPVAAPRPAGAPVAPRATPAPRPPEVREPEAGHVDDAGTQPEPAPADHAAVQEPTMHAVEAEPPAAAMPAGSLALRELPHRVTLRYALQTGEGGFTLGYTLITWHASADHYVLESVTAASGVTALLVRSSATQRSEGRITAHGLVPEHYTLGRGKGRVQQARFDWQAGRLYLPGGDAQLPELAQDLLNFPFHLALTLRGDEAPWRMAVTDGRRLREYAFEVVGHAPGVAQQGDSLHLRGSRAGEGTLDVWLAPALHWLPVRIRTVDHKGTAMVLTLERAEYD